MTDSNIRREDIMGKAADYTSRIAVLMRELRTKTLTEAERERNLTWLDYTGTGYGYNLKNHCPQNLKEGERDIQTPELKQLEKLIASMSVG
jgi:hypothetical protein